MQAVTVSRDRTLTTIKPTKKTVFEELVLTFQTKKEKTNNFKLLKLFTTIRITESFNILNTFEKKVKFRKI